MNVEKLKEVARRIVVEDDGLLYDCFESAIDYLPGVDEVPLMIQALKDLKAAVEEGES